MRQPMGKTHIIERYGDFVAKVDSPVAVEDLFCETLPLTLASGKVEARPRGRRGAAKRRGQEWRSRTFKKKPGAYPTVFRLMNDRVRLPSEQRVGHVSDSVQQASSHYALGLASATHRARGAVTAPQCATETDHTEMCAHSHTD